jgi:anti-anti-sigma regulatory factor
MKIKVAELLGMRDLALRSWAEELFKFLAEKQGHAFVLDFSDIDFVSRSFAHEYLKEKHAFKTSIQEKNMNSNVKQMFTLAAQPPIKKNTNIVSPTIVQNL